MASLTSRGVIRDLDRCRQPSAPPHSNVRPRPAPFTLTHSFQPQQAFIRALTCLSRYGDDLVLHADAQHVTLSATNSSLSAYCRFRYGRMYFSRYRVGGGVNGAGPSNGSPSAPQDVKGQLLVKVRLACSWIRVCMHQYCARRHCCRYSSTELSKKQWNDASWSS